MEKMNVKLQRQVLSLEEYEGPSGTGEDDPDLVLQGIEQDGQAALLAVEDMLSGVETVLHPPGTPWQPEEVNFLLTQSGKLLAKVTTIGPPMCMLGSDWSRPCTPSMTQLYASVSSMLSGLVSRVVSVGEDAG